MTRVLSNNNISILVRSLRFRLGMTQERFAVRLGVTFVTVNRWENGKAVPSAMALQIMVLVAESSGYLDLSRSLQGYLHL